MRELLFLLLLLVLYFASAPVFLLLLPSGSLLYRRRAEQQQQQQQRRQPEVTIGQSLRLLPLQKASTCAVKTRLKGPVEAAAAIRNIVECFFFCIFIF